MEWYLKCLKQHYFDFNGRARRKEYWMYTLVNALISLAIIMMLGAIAPKLIPVVYIYTLAVLMPSLGVGVRRLHDIGKSGWFFLIALVPLANFYLLYLLCLDSESGANAYGESPKQA
ncbi:DUF805 domain-containing protein [Pseudomonas sp. ZM23]|uniref:DUF805 domain-containing protein n=1 Tax=Pseudomonas triclosanedens TaxID=2961893 RepID=A0ABY6ZW12_9PSED|nr:DUF805 domain-containing protein [Pseudomonas triclosanedens]MCP8465271.1 DUF805 domain-containing protein [Pseudomonas triclosanedens]MCP8470789.1 DUF805 domain-containing protein [Pseudomonas triclosanedens]MCP8476520.1 DUF805 domain-containing protein [Pseudomonas triclosanedens]WAI48973.1 DUF805 domain-containing protein [Pseudomonas triclosanedens]